MTNNGGFVNGEGRELDLVLEQSIRLKDCAKSMRDTGAILGEFMGFLIAISEECRRSKDLRRIALLLSLRSAKGKKRHWIFRELRRAGIRNCG